MTPIMTDAVLQNCCKTVDLGFCSVSRFQFISHFILGLVFCFILVFSFLPMFFPLHCDCLPQPDWFHLVPVTCPFLCSKLCMLPLVFVSPLFPWCAFVPARSLVLSWFLYFVFESHKTWLVWFSILSLPFTFKALLDNPVTLTCSVSAPVSLCFNPQAVTSVLFQEWHQNVLFPFLYKYWINANPRLNHTQKNSLKFDRCNRWNLPPSGKTANLS